MDNGAWKQCNSFGFQTAILVRLGEFIGRMRPLRRLIARLSYFECSAGTPVLPL